MKDINQIIQGIVMLIIGICLLFTWKQFALEIAKYTTKYTQASENMVKIGFYFIGSVAILGGILLIIRFLRS
jgi:uncharacterized membrane protein HdeD (DUF308 family)